MKCRYVKITGAAGYGATLAYADKKFTGLEVIGNLAIDSVHAIHARMYLGQQVVELCMVYVWILFVSLEVGRVPFQFLERFGFEVGVAENIEYFQYAGQRCAAVPCGLSRQMVGRLLEQVFKPQKGSDSFVQRLLIENLFRH